MATLAQTLQRSQQQLVVGPGGVLQKQSSAPSTESPPQPGVPTTPAAGQAAPTLQTLVGQAGLQAAPTTPGGIAALGGTPDQAKMGGTPAQKQASLAQAQAPVTDSLSGALRQQQVRSTATGAEKGEIQKSADMTNLGGLGDRVSAMVNSQVAKLSTAAPVEQGVLNAGQLKDVHGNALTDTNQLVQARADITALHADPTNQSLMEAVNRDLGATADTQLAPAQIDNLFQSASSVISSAGAGAIQNTLTGKDLFSDPKFGYKPEELSNLLGLPADQIAGMTVPQIRDQIDKVGTEEMSKSAQMGQLASSGELGQAQRSEAQQAGAELSQTGVRAGEAQYSSMEQQIANADQVQFGGKSYQVDDLLSNPTFSGIITDVISAGPDSPAWKQMQATEPGLMEFVTKNQAVLKEASDKMQAGATQYSGTVAANKAATVLGGVPLSSDIVKHMGIDVMSSKGIGNVPVLQYAQQHPELAAGIGQAINSNPQFAGSISHLSPAQVEALRPGDPTSAAWKGFVGNQQKTQALRSSDPGNVDSVIQALGFPGVTSADQLMEASKSAQSNNALFGTSIKIPDLSAWMTDGKLDGTKLRNWGLDNSVPSIEAAANGTAKTLTPIVPPAAAPLAPMQASISSKLGEAAASGQPISADDLHKANLSVDEALYLQNGHNGARNPNVDNAALDKIIEQNKTSNTNSIIQNASASGLAPDQMIAMLQKAMSDDADPKNYPSGGATGRKVDPAPIQALIQRIQAGVQDEASTDRNTERRVEARKSIGTGTLDYATGGIRPVAQAISKKIRF